MTNLEIGKAFTDRVYDMLEVGGVWRSTELYGPLNKKDRMALTSYIVMKGFAIQPKGKLTVLTKVK